MIRSPQTTLATLSVLLLVLLSNPGEAAAHIMGVANRQYVTFDQMIDDLADARLVFIGELHDQPGHHQAQLDIVKGVRQVDGPVAIGLEMFRAENQAVLDRWVAGKISESEFRREWARNWGMWEHYEEILTYARKENIPLIALNAPREITQQVAREGFDSLDSEQLENIPGVACDVDENYRDYIRRTLGAHGHGAMNFENFCEAQMVWDTTMAHNVVQYLERFPETKVFVLAGSGHAWKYGIPAQVNRRAQVPTRVVLPTIPGRVMPENITHKEADYLLIGIEEGPLH